METGNLNNNMWNKNVHHCDNGSSTIGPIVIFLCPLPIESWIREDIPLIVSHFSVFLLIHPSHIVSIQMNNDIGGNTSLAFVYNGTKFSVHFTSVIKTSYTDSPCDKLMIVDWLGNRGCGCYGIAFNSTSIDV